MPSQLISHAFSTNPALLGPSTDAGRARASCAAAAAERSPVLLIGEEGMDAESVARAIHEASRPGLPFVAVTVAAHDPAGLEMALFGARPRAGVQAVEVLGATGALVAAGRGTLYLDGLGDLPSSTQRRLARLLRDGEARVGKRPAAPLQSRIIASARPDIQAQVRDGSVLVDLYRRVAVQELVLPPLRTRPEDFPSLVTALTSRLASRLARTQPAFTQSALNVLAALPWRRNIRELDALLERILRAVPADTIKQEDVLGHLSFDGAFTRRQPSGSLREARQRFEREYIAAVLEQHDWRMSDAARALGIERANLYRKARQLGISRAGAIHAAAGR